MDRRLRQAAAAEGGGGGGEVRTMIVKCLSLRPSCRVLRRIAGPLALTPFALQVCVYVCMCGWVGGVGGWVGGWVGGRRNEFLRITLPYNTLAT